jgi:hypothetical protein
VRTPGEIFSFMQSNKIGEKVALFWIAWAFVAEKFDNFKLADQIFQKAIKKQAEPKDVLQKRYQQFQRRMARHFLNKMQDESGTCGNEGHSSVPLQAIAGGNQNQENRHIEQRGVPLKPSNVVAAKIPKDNNSQFKIFAEPSDGTGSLVENKSWKSLGKESDRRKENDAPVTKWSEGPLQPNTRPSSLPARPVPTVKIFVDPELADTPKLEQTVVTETGRSSVR